MQHTPFDGLVPVIAGHFVYLSIAESGGIWKVSSKCFLLSWNCLNFAVLAVSQYVKKFMLSSM